MARFAVGRPVKTPEPVVTVDGGLEPGAHRFQLVVTTVDGRVSKPDVVTVTVAGRTPTPTPIPIPRE
jgi:hypothetical protein